MKFLLTLVSKLPFFVLHRFSDFLFYVIYFLVGYRKKVVRENLTRSFPRKSLDEIIRIERKFYRNFCDILIETLKNFSISEKEMRERCKLMTPDLAPRWFAAGKSLAGISSHLANWECLALSLSLEFPHQCYGVYKPLSDKKLNDVVVDSRERFGIKMIPIKKVREIVNSTQKKPYLMGLLSDQAPHDYSKAFEFSFLNQKTYVVPGPGILTVEQNLIPVWGWMRRVGRSRFEWGVEEVLVNESEVLSQDDRDQVTRISKAHSISIEHAKKAFLITREYSRALEKQIEMAPEDWLWSHRRWKSR